MSGDSSGRVGGLGHTVALLSPALSCRAFLLLALLLCHVLWKLRLPPTYPVYKKDLDVSDCSLLRVAR